MSLSVSRAFARRQLLSRIASRNASTTSEAANAASSGAAKAKETASQATSKASEGLTRVTSSTGSAVSKASDAASNALSSIGGRTGRVISFVQSLVPPTVYYSRVGLELGRLVAHGQKMSPPTMATFQSYAEPLAKVARQPASLFNQTASRAGSETPSSMLSRFRNMDNQTMIQVGVVAAEVIGFFTVGEMIGRMKIIGYRSSKETHAHSV